MRQQIIDELTGVLNAIPDFQNVRLWDDVPSQYAHNAIYLKDTREKYEKKNNVYQATLRIEIVAIAIETKDNSAAVLGNIALGKLIGAVTQLSMDDVILNLAESFKFIETKGRTACEVELNIDVLYKFRI